MIEFFGPLASSGDLFEYHRVVYALKKSLKIVPPGPILQSILKVQGSGHFKFKLRTMLVFV